VKQCQRSRQPGIPWHHGELAPPTHNNLLALTKAGTNLPLQLPLGLLTAAQGHPMLVELKNGETLNGHLVNCDIYMNLTLKEVVQTSPDGDKFFRLPECYVRGNNVRWRTLCGIVGSGY